MDREFFSDDVIVDIERRVRWLKQRIERLERAGCETAALSQELTALERHAAEKVASPKASRAA